MQLLETNVGLERKGKISRLDHANFMPNFAQMCDQPDIIMQNLEGCSNYFFFDNPGCPGQLTRTTTNSQTH